MRRFVTIPRASRTIDVGRCFADRLGQRPNSYAGDLPRSRHTFPLPTSISHGIPTDCISPRSAWITCIQQTCPTTIPSLCLKAYQLHLLVFAEGQAYHFAVHFMPRDLGFLLMTPRTGEKHCPYSSPVHVLPGWPPCSHYQERPCSHLNAEAPRISCEAHFAPQVFRLPFSRKG